MPSDCNARQISSYVGTFSGSSGTLAISFSLLSLALLFENGDLSLRCPPNQKPVARIMQLAQADHAVLPAVQSPSAGWLGDGEMRCDHAACHSSLGCRRIHSAMFGRINSRGPFNSSAS